MAHRLSVEEDDDSPAVMQWLWYVGTVCGALLVHFLHGIRRE
jgi:hypothetical protein